MMFEVSRKVHATNSQNIKNITNLIPTAHCESIQNNADLDTNSEVELKDSNDPEIKQR